MTTYEAITLIGQFGTILIALVTLMITLVVFFNEKK